VRGHPLFISPAARGDLAEIGRFGKHAWGKTRSVAYLQRIKEQFWSLTRFPLVGIERSDLSPGMRSLPVASHVVFYRLTDDGVAIVRVLHGRQDPGRYLS
jgi:toxin ParE1/3/4